MVWSMAEYTSPFREMRKQLNLSQVQCAGVLGVPVETFRAWDAGRRTAPQEMIQRFKALQVHDPAHQLVPLRILAQEFHVNVRTLRAAARDGRLVATFGPRPFFGRLTATATRQAATSF